CSRGCALAGSVRRSGCRARLVPGMCALFAGLLVRILVMDWPQHLFGDQAVLRQYLMQSAALTARDGFTVIGFLGARHAGPQRAAAFVEKLRFIALLRVRFLGLFQFAADTNPPGGFLAHVAVHRIEDRKSVV